MIVQEKIVLYLLFYCYYITMSVYPVLEVTSLKNRCSRDIEQFLQEQNIQSNPVVKELVESANLDEFKSKINELNPTVDDSTKYVDIISTLSRDEQQNKWILRTYLVYQLLIILTLSLTDPGLYSAIFTKADGTTEMEIFHLEFKNDVPERLGHIKLGIFGSLTPTSDIDIGFQYSGPSEGYTPCLAYVVSRFELLFKIFTGKTCLDYDVESYADMITVPNPDESSNAEFPDLFYIDSSKIDWNDDTKRELLPIAFNSIVRNAMIADIPDSDITLSNVLSQFPEITKEVVSNLSLSSDSVASAAFETSKDTVRTFLDMNYEQQIQAYYDKVQSAEILKVETLKGKNTIDALNTLTDLQIISLMKAIGDALTLRMESYTCSPTVVHVVRILQAEAQKKAKEARLLLQLKTPTAVDAVNQFTGKYVTTTPAELCNTGKKLETARCVVGLTGFILSALEQLGYMYRFHKVYCEGGLHPDVDNKCKKKIDKYQIRLVHANENIDKLQQHGKGGARRKRGKKLYTRKRVYNRTNKYRRRNNKYYKTTHKKSYKKSVKRV